MGTFFFNSAQPEIRGKKVQLSLRRWEGRSTDTAFNIGQEHICIKAQPLWIWAWGVLTPPHYLSTVMQETTLFWWAYVGYYNQVISTVLIQYNFPYVKPEEARYSFFSLLVKPSSIILFLPDFIWITCLLLLTFFFHTCMTDLLPKLCFMSSTFFLLLYIHLNMYPFTFSSGIPLYPVLHLFSQFTYLHLFYVTFLFGLTLFNIFL